MELKLRIDWSELDLFGHVNNVAIMKYIQASRVNFWDNTGISQLYKERNIGLMLASTSCKFKQPLFYPGNIRILAKINFIKNTSFSFHHTIYNDNGNIAAEADDVMVMYDFSKNEKVVIPDKIRDALSKFI